MAAYYNEVDPYCVAWLRNLIAAGMIAPGDVDERSIEDVRPDDLRGYRQAHFFGGLGAWSYALRLAGIPDDRRIWSGSCPCQPFSAAGKGAGFADERHLWPAFFRLIRECRPERIVGEQVASNLAWLDLVSGDLEGEGYAVGSAIVGAHSIGAPHIRQRLYWVADADPSGRSLERRSGLLDGERQTLGDDVDGCGSSDWLGDPRSVGREVAVQHAESGNAPGVERQASVLGGTGIDDWLGDADDERLEGWGLSGRERAGELAPWATSVFIPCADGRLRPVPVEPSVQPLADGSGRSLGRVRPGQEPAAEIPRSAQGSRVGRLKGYGNAIVPQVAAAFLKALP